MHESVAMREARGERCCLVGVRDVGCCTPSVLVISAARQVASPEPDNAHHEEA